MNLNIQMHEEYLKPLRKLQKYVVFLIAKAHAKQNWPLIGMLSLPISACAIVWPLAESGSVRQRRGAGKKALIIEKDRILRGSGPWP